MLSWAFLGGRGDSVDPEHTSGMTQNVQWLSNFLTARNHVNVEKLSKIG